MPLSDVFTFEMSRVGGVGGGASSTLLASFLGKSIGSAVAKFGYPVRTDRLVNYPYLWGYYLNVTK